MFREIDARLDHVLRIGQPGRDLERPREMAAAEIHKLRRFVHPQRRLKVTMDVMDGLADLPFGQHALAGKGNPILALHDEMRAFDASACLRPVVIECGERFAE